MQNPCLYALIKETSLVKQFNNKEMDKHQPPEDGGLPTIGMIT